MSYGYAILILVCVACATLGAQAAGAAAGAGGGAGFGGGVVVGGGGAGNDNAQEKRIKQMCMAFAEAEEIYRRTDYDRNGVLEYAQVLAGHAEDFKRMPVAPQKVEQLTAEEQEKITKLIKTLNDDDFATREKASAELIAMGTKAYELVNKASTADDAEVGQRCKRIAEKIGAANSPAPEIKLKYQFGLLGSNDNDELALIDRQFAAAECAAGCDPAQSTPKEGYLFRVLTRQSQAARGGKFDYMVNGMMTKGYALLAFPAKYDESTKKCFMISHSGHIFERDFGSKEATDTFVKNCVEFDPSGEWKETSR